MDCSFVAKQLHLPHLHQHPLRPRDLTLLATRPARKRSNNTRIRSPRRSSRPGNKGRLSLSLTQPSVTCMICKVLSSLLLLRPWSFPLYCDLNYQFKCMCVCVCLACTEGTGCYSGVPLREAWLSRLDSRMCELCIYSKRRKICE